MKNIELSGEVEENPYKLKIRNKYDGKLVRTDLTIDSRRKLIDFQTNYDIGKYIWTILYHFCTLKTSKNIFDCNLSMMYILICFC